MSLTEYLSSILKKVSPSSEPAKDVPTAKGGFGEILNRSIQKMNSAEVSGNGFIRFFQKAKIFLTSMVSELTTPKVAKEKASGKASKEIGDTVSKFEKLKAAVSDLDSYKNGSSNSAMQGLEKVTKAIGGESVDKFTFAESTNLTALAFAEMKKLKAQAIKESGNGPAGEKKLAEIFESLEESSRSTKFPISKIMSGPVFSLFKAKNADDKQEKGLRFLERIGITPDWKDIAKAKTSLGNGGRAMEAGELLSQIGKKPIDKKPEVVAFVHKHIFKETSEANIGSALDVIGDIADPKNDGNKRLKVAKLAFLLEDKDFDNVVAMMIGERKK